MPEMPEVENVRRDIERQLPRGAQLQEVHFYRSDLRFPIPKKELSGLVGETLLQIRRRGKYILFIFEKGIMISHLGMTGKWKMANELPLREKHDHVVLFFKQKCYLVYCDPRRFGYLQFAAGDQELREHPLRL
jgi:formamidopyrimidine-DNA glycosylase